MAIGLIFFPVLLAVAAFAMPRESWRPWLLLLASAVHLFLSVKAWIRPDLAGATEWLALDALGRIALLLISVLFAMCSIYAVGFLRYRHERSNRIFVGCMLTVLGMMSLVIWSHHLGLMWVAIEATTLATAPLIYFNRTPRSIEATWKFLLLGSVGIALALLGTFFLAYASLHEQMNPSLVLEDLVRHAPRLSKPWLHAAFILLLVGYGTKMGLAPMHTWKPDAYGEASGVAGALMAGGVTTCAFLAVVRIYQICAAAGESPFASRVLIFMGLFSMAVAGVFMVGQRDFKRMLAYSSVEHMGILVLGIGIGGGATFGALLHMINNALAKGVMLLSAGNIQRAYQSKSTDDVRGALRRLPMSGALFLTGFLAITGSPPFGPFLSEFTIFNGALGTGRFVTSGFFLLFLLIVFIGMGATVLMVVQGRPSPAAEAGTFRDGPLTVIPVVILMVMVLILGLYLPDSLQATLRQASALVEARP